jgi:hypothetical protein
MPTVVPACAEVFTMATATTGSKVDPELLLALYRINTESLSITEAAAHVGLSYNQFRRKLVTGQIPYFTIASVQRVWKCDVEPTA